jgi:hypothetical protein
VEVKSHTFISFGRFGITHSVFVIVKDVIREECLTVSLYRSGCGEDEALIEGKVYACTAVPIPINRICKLFLSPTVKKAV